MKTLKKSIFILTILAAMFMANTRAHAQDNGFGVGIIIGEPTGFSGKYWLNSTTAIDGGLAWSFVKGTAFHIHADYLLHSSNIFKPERHLNLYYGGGLRLKTEGNDGARFGVRGVIGVDLFMIGAPVDFFLEAAPVMDFNPSTELTFNGGIGVRWFFGKKAI
jgi:hypothetical protein